MGVIVSLAAAMTGCGDNSNVNGAVASLSISPTSPTISVGGSQSFTATATFNDGTAAQDVTSTSTWSSSITTVATISGSVAKAVSAGESTITATYTQGTNSVDASTNLVVVSAQSAVRDGIARVVFGGVPNGALTGATMDGAQIEEAPRGSSLAIDTISGVHKFVSPNGRHTFLLNLRADAVYTFAVLPDGQMELADSRD